MEPHSCGMASGCGERLPFPPRLGFGAQLRLEVPWASRQEGCFCPCAWSLAQNLAHLISTRNHLPQQTLRGSSTPGMQSTWWLPSTCSSISSGEKSWQRRGSGTQMTQASFRTRVPYQDSWRHPITTHLDSRCFILCIKNFKKLYPYLVSKYFAIT